MTTTKQKSVGAKQGRGATGRSPWRRLKDAIADIERGVYPTRAFDRHNLPQAWLEDHRINRRIRSAEANLQTVVVSTVFDSAIGDGTSVIEGDWSPTHTVDGTRAPTRTRAWSKRDPKSATWLLERRFPSEFGSQQPAQVAESVVQVLSALAALRSQPAPPLASFRHVPQLPEGTEDARAREGQAT